MAAHSSTLAWKIPWAEEPGGLQSMESRKRCPGLKRRSTRACRGAHARAGAVTAAGIPAARSLQLAVRGLHTVGVCVCVCVCVRAATHSLSGLHA